MPLEHSIVKCGRVSYRVRVAPAKAEETMIHARCIANWDGQLIDGTRDIYSLDVLCAAGLQTTLNLSESKLAWASSASLPVG